MVSFPSVLHEDDLVLQFNIVSTEFYLHHFQTASFQ